MRTALPIGGRNGGDSAGPAAADRGRAALARGRRQLFDGPVGDARASLLLAASLLAADAPDRAEAARLAAADAAWATGDVTLCLTTLDGTDTAGRAGGYAGLVTAAATDKVATDKVATDKVAADQDGAPTTGLDADRPASPDPTDVTVPPAESGPPESSGGPGPGWARDAFVRDYRDGMRALLARTPDRAAGPLRRVLDQARTDGRTDRLLRAAAAALLLGDVRAARAAGARALAAARDADCPAAEARALEYLAYGELRAGCHAQARTHAEEGVRAALAAGYRNTAASHHAMLALAASIEGDTATVARHASVALTTARRHGLAQTATLAEWATARADLARGRPLDAYDRLGPLVGPGPRRGHFAVWMLALPCYVEAAVLAGHPQDASTVLADLARWAAFGVDPHAPAQLARCRALLAPDDRADDLYLRALALHDERGGDFERARTELLHGRWLRRRRRLREARSRLGAALVGFERCGAGAWADQTRGELRANGAASVTEAAGGLSRLTPQQLRIARYVAEGATNREVAQRLAVSTRTVDYHLRNVFAALGVRSRMELARMVDQESR
ncbi:hypothetical protein GCM10010256_49280 [Streptomyces coeruleorubidus]|nr:hypothetical protein GCM10010256_49280 [Streptomyces coeruleorubidus]